MLEKKFLLFKNKSHKLPTSKYRPVNNKGPGLTLQFPNGILNFSSLWVVSRASARIHSCCGDNYFYSNMMNNNRYYNGSGQNEATAANLLLQTRLRPFHSIFSDKFLRRQLFFGLIIFSKLSVYSGRRHILFKYRLSAFPIGFVMRILYRILKTVPTGIRLEKWMAVP